MTINDAIDYTETVRVVNADIPDGIEIPFWVVCPECGQPAQRTYRPQIGWQRWVDWRCDCWRNESQHNAAARPEHGDWGAAQIAAGMERLFAACAANEISDS